jgi:heme exporter protein A
MLDVINLDFDYADTSILRRINFSVKPGKLLHLRGPNGVGKTTLLKLLSGLLQPTQGEIHYQGHSIAQNLASYQQNLCYIGHKSGISQILTVRENCYFELQHGRDVKMNISLDALFQRFSLTSVSETPCHLLSAGLRRRVALLRLMLSNATLWLLDEPFVALDQAAVEMLTKCMLMHLQNMGCIILTSHQSLPFNAHYQEYCL